MDCSCFFRRLILNNSQHSQAPPLCSVDASHGITHSWALNVIKLSLTLVLVFSVLSRILNSTVLLLYPRLR